MDLRKSIKNLLNKNIYLIGKKIEKISNNTISCATIYLFHITGKIYNNARFVKKNIIVISDENNDDIIKFDLQTEEYIIL